jgi:hypothetical protein
VFELLKKFQLFASGQWDGGIVTKEDKAFTRTFLYVHEID